MSDVIARKAEELLAACKLTPHQACIAYGGQWTVYLYENRKKPPIVKWYGEPVTYTHIGGKPEPYAV